LDNLKTPRSELLEVGDTLRGQRAAGADTGSLGSGAPLFRSVPVSV
jgi:hypothetical protein